MRPSVGRILASTAFESPSIFSSAVLPHYLLQNRYFSKEGLWTDRAGWSKCWPLQSRFAPEGHKICCLRSRGIIQAWWSFCFRLEQYLQRQGLDGIKLYLFTQYIPNIYKSVKPVIIDTNKDPMFCLDDTFWVRSLFCRICTVLFRQIHIDTEDNSTACISFLSKGIWTISPVAVDGQ